MCRSLCSPCVQQMSWLTVVCWFWQTQYIQSDCSAVFSSYVTTIRTRGRTNIKPQDPGEPKVPFGLVPHLLPLPLLLHPPLVFLCFSFCWTTTILPTPLPFLVILSSLMSLLPSLSPSSLFFSSCSSSNALLFKSH